MDKKILCNLQLAQHHHNESEDKGEITLENFIKIINEFPWLEQSKKANELQRSSPTISLKTNDYILWISSYLDDNEIIFLVGFIEYIEKKKLIGSGTKRIEKQYQNETKNVKDLEKNAKQFYEEKFEELKQSF